MAVQIASCLPESGRLGAAETRGDHEQGVSGLNGNASCPRYRCQQYHANVVGLEVSRHSETLLLTVAQPLADCTYGTP
jgi:hypothetical protein